MTIRKKDIFFVLNELSEVMSLTKDPGKLLDTVMDQLLELLGIDCCWMQLLNPNSRKLELVSSRGFTSDIKREMAILDMEHGLYQQILGLGNKVVISNIHRDGAYGLSSFGKNGFYSLVAVPVRTHRVHGIMGIASRNKMRLPNELPELLIVIASMVIIALLRANLYQSALIGERRTKTGRQLKAESSPDEEHVGNEVACEPVNRPAVDEPNNAVTASTVKDNAIMNLDEYSFENHADRMKIFRDAHMRRA